jgi:hypothetical protein
MLNLVPKDYRALFQFVLPHLAVRTTDVHVATCMPFVHQLIQMLDVEVDESVVSIALILHDIGWSRLSEAEVASSLGVSGLKLTPGASGPKEKHVVLGQELAAKILDTYEFNPALSTNQKQLILDSVLYHDKPWELAGKNDTPMELKLVCDVDHLWSFTHQNFWQDTVRKGVGPEAYLKNLQSDLDEYFITNEAKTLAKQMLDERKAEVAELEQLILESIIASWKINPEPEYRGFRCANCQNYINEAFYHWLQNSHFFIPVHFCEHCQQLFENGELDEIPQRQSSADVHNFHADYPGKKTFQQLVQSWKPSSDKKLTSFYCDKCALPLEVDQSDDDRKGYHVWWLNDNLLYELHFHKECGNPLIVP